MTHLLRSGNPGSPRCSICGCERVRLDHWDDVEGDGASLELGECPRCDHRWTRQLAHPLQARCASPDERVAPELAADASDALDALDALDDGCPRFPVAA